MRDFHIIGSILAAGRSGRMGRNKLILKSRNNLSILDQVIDNAINSHLSRIHLLMRGDDAPVNITEHESIALIEISSAQMSDSVRAAIENAQSEDASHVMILLGDMPSVTPQDINALIEAAHGNPGSFVTAVHDGTVGNPVVLPLAGCAEWIDQLNGDAGARKVIESGLMPVVRVECSKGVLVDIDTPQAYAAYLAE